MLVQREEILDGRTRIAGYRFRAVPTDVDAPPSLIAKTDALKNDNLAGFAERRMAVVSLKADEWASGLFQQFVTPNTIFEVAVPAPGADVESWQQSVEAMKASGAKIGLDSIVTSPRLSNAMALADAIVVRPADYSDDGLFRTIANLRDDGRKPVIIVDGVHTWTDFRACVGAGASYCMGAFAAAPDSGNGADLPPQNPR